MTKLLEGNFPGFTKFDIVSVTDTLIDKAVDYVGGNCVSLLQLIVKKTLGYNKCFDYISLSQFEEKLKFSKSKVISLLKLAEKKEVILTYLEGKKGQQKKYYFLNTPTFKKIIKAVKKGLINFSDILDAEKKFIQERTFINVFTQKNKSANKTEMFLNWKQSRDSYYDKIAESLIEKDNDIFLPVSKSDRGSIKKEQDQCKDKTGVVSKTDKHLDNSYIDKLNIDKSSSEQKETSTTENLLETQTLNDDDFLNNSINETTTELVVNEDFNNSESKDNSKHKENVLRENKNVGTREEIKVPPVSAADCGQNVDKENTYKRIIAIGVKENIAKEIIETVKLEVLKDYLSAVPVWRASGNIKNIPGFYYSSVKDPAKYPLPEEVLTEKKQAEKKKDSNKLREFCKFLGLDVTSTKEIIKGYVSSCKNIFMDKEKLKFKIYNESFNRWVDDHGPTEAEKIANANVRKVISELDKNRLLLEKVLAYLKINTDINHYNLLNIIKRANDKIEMQFAGV